MHAQHAQGLAALFAMWAAMSVAMMVPVEMPSLVRAARVRPALSGPAAFLGGYVLAWIGFSIAAAFLQHALHGAGWMSAEMTLNDAPSRAALLAAAGLLQLSPLRRACLARCRAASSDTTEPGFNGGLRSGLASIACCGLLMLPPFATGAMNAAWMVALTALLVLEREFPRAERAGMAAGVFLLALAGWQFAV